MYMYLLRHIKCCRTSKRKAGSGLCGSKSLFFLLFHLTIKCTAEFRSMHHTHTNTSYIQNEVHGVRMHCMVTNITLNK